MLAALYYLLGDFDAAHSAFGHNKNANDNTASNRNLKELVDAEIR